MPKSTTPFEALEQLVKEAGSLSALARALGVSQPTVWRWRNETRQLPAEHVLKAEELYGVSRHDLRPDLYPRDYPPAPEYRSAEDGAHRLCGAGK